MSTGKAVTYLEKLQEEVFQKLGRPLDEIVKDYADAYSGSADDLRRRVDQANLSALTPEQLIAYKQMIEDTIQRIDNAQLPTRYENHASYDVITRYAKLLEEGSKNVVLKFGDTKLKVSDLLLTVKRPLFGTLPTGQVNARCIAVPESDEYIIAFEEDFIIFCLLISKVVARAIPLKRKTDGSFSWSFKEEHIKKSVRKDKQSKKRLKQMLIAYLINGRVGHAEPYIIDEPYGQILAPIAGSMTLFVIGHEYGHILAGHLRNSELLLSSMNGTPVKEVNFSWIKELEADITGLILTYGGMRMNGFDEALCFGGVDLFFSALDIVYRGMCLLKTGNEDWQKLVKIESRSHPPPHLRREAARMWIRDAHGEKSVEFGRAIDMIIELLWKEVSLVLMEQYRKGSKLAPKWKPQVK